MFGFAHPTVLSRLFYVLKTEVTSAHLPHYVQDIMSSQLKASIFNIT